MPISRIAVLRENVVANADGGELRPIYAVATEGQPTRYGIGLVILGPSTCKYDPNGNPQLGNRVWIETAADVILTETPYETASGLPGGTDCRRC